MSFIVYTCLHNKWESKLLIRSPYTCILHHPFQHLANDSSASITADISRFPLAVAVLRDRCIFSPMWMVIPSEHLGSSRCNQLHPGVYLIMLLTYAKRIIPQSDMLRLDKQVIANAARLTDQSGLTRRANLNMLIGKATLERVHDMSAIPYELI